MSLITSGLVLKLWRHMILISDLPSYWLMKFLRACRGIDAAQCGLILSLCLHRANGHPHALYQH